MITKRWYRLFVVMIGEFWRFPAGLRALVMPIVTSAASRIVVLDEC